MRTRTVIKYTHNLTDKEYVQCFNKNMGSKGQMRDALERCRYRKKTESRVVLIKEEKTKEILGWALIQPRTKKSTKVMFWVEPQYRRNGYGARLLKHTTKIDPKPFVYPWDNRSASFFKNNIDRVRVEKHDKFWMR